MQLVSAPVAIIVTYVCECIYVHVAEVMRQGGLMHHHYYACNHLIHFHLELHCTCRRSFERKGTAVLNIVWYPVQIFQYRLFREYSNI